MLTIGFTQKYYTLWDVTQSQEGSMLTTREMYNVTNYRYVQNLSYSFEEAVAKVKKLTEEYEVDMDLRGENGSFEVRTPIGVSNYGEELHWFSFGKFKACDMRESTEVWQLMRAMKEEPYLRRRVIARRRLIELGELVIYRHVEKLSKYRQATEEEMAMGLDHGNPGQIWYKEERSHKYCPTKKAQELKASGHHFKEGARIDVCVKQIKSFSYKTAYGTTFIDIMMTDDGKLVKYKGSSVLMFPEDGSFMKIKGTVEHGEYCGVLETRLKRIKVL